MKISILGCGWLGLPLARHFLQKGYKIKGSTTNKQKLSLLEEAGITPYLISLSPQIVGDIEAFLENAEVSIINIPPQRRQKGDTFHPQQIEHLLPYLQKADLKQIIYVSATSVYPELNKEVGEEEATRVANPALWDSEQLLQNTLKGKVCTLRLGGLMGDDRVAGKYFAGKKNLKTGGTPVNYIHRDDAIGIITKVIEQEIKNEVLNVVAPQHPTRKEVYLHQAQKYGFEAPTFVATTTDYKQVSTEKLRNLLNYTFQYPDPLNFK